jgi:hypothetical protein
MVGEAPSLQDLLIWGRAASALRNTRRGRSLIDFLTEQALDHYVLVTDLRSGWEDDFYQIAVQTLNKHGR